MSRPYMSLAYFGQELKSPPNTCDCPYPIRTPWPSGKVVTSSSLSSLVSLATSVVPESESFPSLAEVAE